MDGTTERRPGRIEASIVAGRMTVVIAERCAQVLQTEGAGAACFEPDVEAIYRAAQWLVTDRDGRPLSRAALLETLRAAAETAQSLLAWLEQTPG